MIASDSSSSCSAPDSYYYGFSFDFNCYPRPQIPAHEYVYFDVAEGSNGPWVQYDSIDYDGSAYGTSGTMHEGNISSNYQWYRFRLVEVWCNRTTNGQTDPDRICGTQVTPTPTYTPTPTVTPTFNACLQTITEGFEGGTLGIFSSSGPPGWSAVTDNPHSGVYAAYAPDVGYVSDSHLTLNNPIAIPLNTTQATLSFWQRYDFDITGSAAWDGGVLEISSNGGPWNDVTITSGGYNGVLVTCPSLNPLAGKQAWVGSSGGWVQAFVDLMPYRGQSIRFRFREGTSETVGAGGWWIDDVIVYFTQGFCWTPTATATPCSPVPCTNTPTNTSTRTPTNTTTPNPCPRMWSVVNSPSIHYWNYLYAVAAASANDVWAVGYTTESGPWWTLVEHWDGTAWSVVSSPNVGTNDNELYGVAAVSANDVWAVGQYYDGSAYPTLVEHWDGTAWSVVSSPDIGTGDRLDGVAAVSANNVWAVGTYGYGYPTPYQTLVEHWDGSSWSVVSSPNVGANSNRLNAVVAVSNNDVWAVGYRCLSSGYDCGQSTTGAQTLTEHWNGTAWSVVPSPNVGAGSDILTGVAAVSPTDLWAVGEYFNDCCHFSDTLVEHWNGTAWSVVFSPNVGTEDDELYAVTAVSANDVWAVGYCYNGGQYLAVVEHWNGTTWSVVPSPNPGPRYNSLRGVVAVSPTNVWPAGYYSSGNSPGPNQTLVLHYTAICNTPTSTPTFTNTPTPVLVGHVTWQSRAAEPSASQQLPLTLTLKSGATEVNYPPQTTDASGFFTVSVASLSLGTYNWLVKGPDGAVRTQASDPPGFLANSGTVTLTGAASTQVEMGLMQAGDANNDNYINAADFNILKVSFGKGVGDPGYDNRADFTGDGTVNVSDFAALKNNFGHTGAPPLHSE